VEVEKEEKEKQAQKEEANKLSGKTNQPKINEAINKLTKCDLQGAKQTSYDKKLLELLACKFVPFEIVNSQEFKNFVFELDKTINLKHSTTYSRQMKDFSAEVLDDVKKAVDEFCNASAAITTDLWTSRARDSYISITLHFVDKMFRLHR
jgi:hypothetical protein